jgi:hypothetical protein
MKKFLVLTLICVLVLPLMWVQPVSAGGKGLKNISCDQMIVYDWGAGSNHWVGNLSGCPIAGTVEYWETDLNFSVGKTEHFFEEFLITTPTGTISGMEKGIWNFATFKFRAEGWVTKATGEWTYLVGYKFHEMGTTTDPNIGTAIYGPSTMFLTP